MQGDDKQSTDVPHTDKDSQYQLSAQVIGKHKFDKNLALHLKQV